MIESGTAHANPLVRRRSWRALISGVMNARRALSEESVATVLGISRARLRAFLGRTGEEHDEARGPAFPVDAIPALLDAELGDDGAALYDEILGELARIRGRAVIPLPDVGAGECDLAHLESLQRSTTSTVTRLLAAIVDLRIDRAEASPIRPLIRDAIACLLRWDCILASVEREGVCSIRGSEKR